MKQKLTKRGIEAIGPSKSDKIVWDGDLRGFGLKVTPAGRKTFFLYYRTGSGQQRRPAIGTFPEVTPEAARAIARQWLLAIAAGGDPSLDRRTQRAELTVSQLCDRYLTDHAEARKRASSLRNDRRLIETHVRPAWGGRKAGAIERRDVVDLHQSLRKTPYEANRLLALLSKMFSLAERWQIRGEHTNPARNVDRFPEKARQRFLSGEELQRLSAALEAESSEGVAREASIEAIRFLLFTGCRLSEVLTLRWTDVDFEDGALQLRETKSGNKRVYLGEKALSLLQRRKREADKAEFFVFPGRIKGKPIVNLQKPWRRIRARAELGDVRLHDLRHTFASIGASLNLSLPMIGGLLGHSQPSTTARYAHLSGTPKRRSADLIVDSISTAMASGKKRHG